MANLASEFQRQDCRVELVTARWDKAWPAEIVHREIKVTRLNQPKARGWGTARYMQSLSSWIRKSRHDLDGILVSMMKHDAHAAIRCGRMHGIPVAVRAEGAGKTGDCHWHTVGRFGMRIRETTCEAPAWIAPSDAVYRELIDAGYPKERGHLIPNGVPVPQARGEYDQQDARIALAEAHPILTVAPKEPLVVYTGRLHEGKGLEDLIEAWSKIIDSRPHARLWLLGEGPHAPVLWQLIRQLELTHTVIMPGSFDDLTEVLYAADAFVLPSYEEGMSMSLLEAMAAGIPVAASDIPGNRKLVDDRRHGLLFPTHRPEAIRAAILEILDQAEPARQRASAARDRVELEFSVQRMAERHLNVLRELVETCKNAR